MDFIVDDIVQLFEDSRKGLQRVVNTVVSLMDCSKTEESANLDTYDTNRRNKTSLPNAGSELDCRADVETESIEAPPNKHKRGLINQVILNLVADASLAVESQSGTGRGLIKVEKCATKTKFVCKISDKRPGPEPDNSRRVSGLFWAAKALGKGTGLGLSTW